MKMRSGRMSLVAGACLLVSVGCGGGGGTASESAVPGVIIDWPTRTRDFGADSAAQSVDVHLHYTSGSQADVDIVGNRNSDLAAHTEIYKFNRALPLGTYSLTASFYSLPSQTGVVTATASANAALFSCGCLEKPNDTSLGTIGFSSSIQSVYLLANQTSTIGSTSQLSASALDSSGSLIAVTPGSFQFQMGQGTGSATITPDGQITGISAGTIPVTATVDGLTSPPINVTVQAAGIANLR